MIEVVSATRMSEDEFWQKSALGLSLLRLGRDPRLATRLSYENRRGLPDVYNTSISARNENEYLVFIHDDVWIDDYYFVDRIIEGLRHFEVLGVAGNRRRMPRQTSWAFVGADFSWDDDANLTGSIATGPSPFGAICLFGPVPAECELLDGVFLAARRSVLQAHNVMFDPRFQFHMYDVDFCRTARQQGLRLATWPICMTHQSEGAFGTPQWHEMMQTYLDKWGD